MADPKAPFWETLKADLSRLSESDCDVRGMVRGLLSQGFHAIVVYRIFRWCYERGIPTQPVRFVAERLIEMTTGISIPVQARIGKGFRIHHFGGIMVHPDAVIGDRCTVYHGVTLGDRGGWGGAPRLGHDVMVGAGAKILGAVQVGDRSIIGANAVVLSSVPSDSIAVGVPAVVRPKGVGQHHGGCA
jgi:serine O-acetyltransferase